MESRQFFHASKFSQNLALISSKFRLKLYFLCGSQLFFYSMPILNSFRSFKLQQLYYFNEVRRKKNGFSPLKELIFFLNMLWSTSTEICFLMNIKNIYKNRKEASTQHKYQWTVDKALQGKVSEVFLLVMTRITLSIPKKLKAWLKPGHGQWKDLNVFPDKPELA